MSTNVSRHEWVIAPFRADRDAVILNSGADWHVIDAHRNFRGPYTAAGQLVRRLVGRVCASAPDLVDTYQLTLLSVAPDLKNHIPVSDEVAKLLTFSREGDSPSWTLRFAHGLTDFILSCVARGLPSRLFVAFENVELADPVDHEFMAVLLRRADPERLTVRVCSSSYRLNDPLQSALKTHASTRCLEPVATPAFAEIPDPWRLWLKESMAGWAGEWITLSDLSEYVDLTAIRPPSSNLQEFVGHVVAQMLPDQQRALANEYVRSECMSDNLLLSRAYASVPSAEQRALHRARVAELEALSDRSFSLGAIPFHHEQGAGEAAVLLAASNHCMHFAYYEGALDWALRGRRMLNGSEGEATFGELTRNALFSFLLLGRFNELELLCEENLTLSKNPALLIHTTYAKAILNARFYTPSRRDYEAARAWVEKSRTFTEMMPPSEGRAVNIAFLRNTMALVEMRTGRPEVANELLTSAIDYLGQEAPGRYEEEVAILLQNRARLQVSLKQFPGALDDFTKLLQHQPSNTDAYFERGVLFQRLGRAEDALRDYNAAIKWSPPYPEAYFNRAQTLVSLGRIDEALADYAYILTLAPDHIEAFNSRARLLLDRGDFEASRTDVEAALLLNPRHARLLCLHGLLEIKAGHLNLAYESFTKSIEADPLLADAWANRATVLFKQGDLNGSSIDLTQALSLREDGAAYYNRGRVFESQNRWAEAIDDYSRALKLTSGDVRHILRHRILCLGKIR